MKNIFTMILQIIFICTISTLAQRQWTQQNSGTVVELIDVYFLDSNIGWTVGNQHDGSSSSGLMLTTTDGGNSWITLSTNIEYFSFYSPLFFRDINTGIAAGSGGILKTTDGGLNWEIKFNGTIKAISFYDNENGIGWGYDGTTIVTVRTTDGGNNWLAIANLDKSFWDISFASSTTAFLVGNGGSIYRTTDGGNNWENLDNPAEDDLFGVHFFDENFGTVVGDHTVIQTTDGGDTWVLRDLPIGDLFGVYCASETECTVAGTLGTILHTTDGGLNWVVENSGTTVILRDVKMIGNGEWIIVGKNGIILKTESAATGNIVGIVQSTGAALENVLVKLLDAFGLPVDGFDDVYTDANGEYSFADVPIGDYQVGIVEPLGYMVDLNPKPAVVIATETTTVDFLLTEVVLLNNARSKGYWKHQFDVYVMNRGNAQESEQDLEAYLVLVQDHYNLWYVIFTDVNTFEEWQAILSLKGNHPMEDRAKQHLSALILNMVSNKIGQYNVVTDDGRDVGDVIQYVSELIKDGDGTNDELAKDLAESVNNQQIIAAGIVPEGDILFKVSSEVGEVLTYDLENNYPNPFNPSTEIKYQIPDAGLVILKVYDILGNEVAELVNENKQPGSYEVEFNAVDLASGVYLYKLSVSDFVDIKKMILMK